LIALAILGLLAGAIIFRRMRHDSSERKGQNRLLLALVSLFLLALLPAINLRLSLYETLGERFLYLPTVFSCLLIGYISNILIRHRAIWLILLVCVLGVYSWRLYASNRLWHEAAQLTESITGELKSFSATQPLTILNVPDNLRGVPIFHNGLPEALQYFQGQKRWGRVEINSFQSLQTTHDVTELRESAGTLTLQPIDRLDTFDRVLSSECFEPFKQATESLRLERKPCLGATAVYYFSGGKMQVESERQSAPQ
jgi:hypothetical protein